jgi:hypothetical protein
VQVKIFLLGAKFYYNDSEKLYLDSTASLGSASSFLSTYVSAAVLGSVRMGVWNLESE